MLKDRPEMTAITLFGEITRQAHGRDTPDEDAPSPHLRGY